MKNTINHLSKKVCLGRPTRLSLAPESLRSIGEEFKLSLTFLRSCSQAICVYFWVVLMLAWRSMSWMSCHHQLPDSEYASVGPSDFEVALGFPWCDGTDRRFGASLELALK